MKILTTVVLLTATVTATALLTLSGFLFLIYNKNTVDKTIPMYILFFKNGKWNANFRRESQKCDIDLNTAFDDDRDRKLALKAGVSLCGVFDESLDVVFRDGMYFIEKERLPEIETIHVDYHNVDAEVYEFDYIGEIREAESRLSVPLETGRFKLNHLLTSMIGRLNGGGGGRRRRRRN